MLPLSDLRVGNVKFCFYPSTWHSAWHIVGAHNMGSHGMSPLFLLSAQENLLCVLSTLTLPGSFCCASINLLTHSNHLSIQHVFIEHHYVYDLILGAGDMLIKTDKVPVLGMLTFWSRGGQQTAVLWFTGHQLRRWLWAAISLQGYRVPRWVWDDLHLTSRREVSVFPCLAHKTRLEKMNLTSSLPQALHPCVNWGYQSPKLLK